MGSTEDQPEIRGSGSAREAGPRSPASPQTRVSAEVPQKTLPQKPKEDGPEFDFSSPRVAAAEAALREAAERLQVSLRESLQGRAAEEAYPDLRKAVDAALPGFHARYEEYVRAVTATGTSQVTCSRGCGHCCSHYVSSVESFELVFLHGRIRRDPAYPSRLVAFHRRAALFNGLLGGRMDEAADDRALFKYYLRNIPCPFLSSSGECGVYEARPMSCRMFFSQSHPSLCKGKFAASPGNRNFIVELPDDIEATLARTSALLADFELPESLFEGLLEANARFGRLDAEADAWSASDASSASDEGPASAS